MGQEDFEIGECKKTFHIHLRQRGGPRLLSLSRGQDSSKPNIRPPTSFCIYIYIYWPPPYYPDEPDFFIKESDTEGGSGANFLVEWVSEHPVQEPIIEAVMVGRQGRGLAAFSRTGVVIKQFRAPPSENE